MKKIITMLCGLFKLETGKEHLCDYWERKDQRTKAVRCKTCKWFVDGQRKDGYNNAE